MKLDKAIELGKQAFNSLKKGKFHDHADAVHLLIECATRIEDWRTGKVLNAHFMLPGETEDDSPP